MNDVRIIGAGLAGTALAWALVRRGVRVRLIDREPESTTSRVAAGLLTPITGKKPAVSWRWAEFRPVAERFYRQAEEATGERFFFTRPVLRVFTSDAEREAFGMFAELATVCDEGVVMPSAAQLDTVAYLDASREWFRQRGMYERGEWDGAVEGVTVLCQGYVPGGPFPLPFRPAKGEVLTVWVPGLDTGRVMNRGGWWLAPYSPSPLEGEGGRRPGEGSVWCSDPPPGTLRVPTSPSRGEVGGSLFRFGATYSWHQLDGVPTAAGRAELETKLRKMTAVTFEVVGHSAGVRPIVAGQKPILGMHPTIPNLGVFNGLGSKGALTAPLFAEQFAAHLCDGTPLDAEVDVRQRTR